MSIGNDVLNLWQHFLKPNAINSSFYDYVCEFTCKDPLFDIYLIFKCWEQDDPHKSEAWYKSAEK